MCMACQEMELYYAYLDAVEEQKRKAQPWQCEVTLIPDGDETPPAIAANPASVRAPKPLPKPSPKPAAKSGFVCDDPE